MKIALIAALDKANGIGYQGQLLCHLPKDLKHFKLLTTGHPVIMGRKTFDSLPGGALPNRRNIVITRDAEYTAANCEMAHSLDEAFALTSNEEIAFVIGGASIYAQALDKADILELTHIDATLPADTYFPQIDPNQWEEVASEYAPADERNAYDVRFVRYLRK